MKKGKSKKAKDEEMNGQERKMGESGTPEPSRQKHHITHKCS